MLDFDQITDMTEDGAYFASDYPVNIYGLSEQSLTVEFGAVITEELLSLITEFNQLLWRNPFPGLITTIPAYCTLTVYFDPLTVLGSDLAGAYCFDKVSSYLKKLGETRRVHSNTAANQYVIPVCYGGSMGADIFTVSKANKLSEAEVVERHTSAQYTVYMIGFVPGFAYMGGMDASLATPRKAVPDAKIPAGSVGIAGMQTGIYPLETPGGWQIIGRTPLKMFDVNRLQPSLLKGGDIVSFKAIGFEEFNAYTER
ncbi:5-oxoprolinase subunit PxpB [Pedobacter psychrodurus]|uniref:5-oxoprolinase subunit PxpB n=1 Tax=Pedobacter psychrodurus TaxID=2530456 RepID=UPI00292E01B8|nr:5-oxoprolinase subunit PxpB [Pedobacter psychrodurus]